MKEMASTFFDRLGEVENTTNQYPFARNDPDLRERISKEVELKVKDGYGAFWTKAQGKGIEKCEFASAVFARQPADVSDLRGTPEEVVKRVQTIFR
jgi:hypothetical protein